MSTLFDITKELSEEYFINNKWNKIGWGSLRTRRLKNTLCYELFVEKELSPRKYIKGSFVYFPKDWEGQFGTGRYDVREMVIFDNEYDDHTYGIKVNKVCDLNIFINAMLNNDEDIKKLTKFGLI